MEAEPLLSPAQSLPLPRTVLAHLVHLAASPWLCALFQAPLVEWVLPLFSALLGLRGSPSFSGSRFFRLPPIFSQVLDEGAEF